MPFDTPAMATMSEHIRYNIISNGLCDIEITDRLRRLGYTRPERYLSRFKRGDTHATDKLILIVAQLIEEQDARRAAALS